MKFVPNSVFVSHAGLPSGLVSRQDWKDFIDDTEKEIAALETAWADYLQHHEATAEDQLRFETIRDRLHEIREDALVKWRSMRGNKPGLAC